MIKEVKRNELRWALPFIFRKQNESLDYNALALSIVNSDKRQFEINGFLVISQNKDDLNYINVFSNVRIKHFFINSIKLYYIDYASNYDLYYRSGRFSAISEHEQNKYFIDFDMLLSGFKSLDDVTRAKQRHDEIIEKRSNRAQAQHAKDIIKNNRKKIASKLLENKINQYQKITDVNGYTYYIKNNVLYRYWDLTTKFHHGLKNATDYGRLETK